MNELVYLSPNTREPFTTSDVIAEYAGVKKHGVNVLIQKHESDFKEFGQVSFEMRAVRYSRGTNMEKLYHLNEPQATLLITYLKNTQQVRAFKKELVRQFYEMRRELERINTVKEERRSIRRSMTDEIKALPDSPHKAYKYAQFSDLSYRVALGKSARQIRKERGAKKSDTASNYMTADELAAVGAVENKIGVLLSLKHDYRQIKEELLTRR